MDLSFNEYQYRTAETAVYPGQGTILGLCYVGLGLGESGEIQGKIKKILRDDNGVVTDEKRSKIKGEIGDELWYLARLCEELGIKLSDCASGNLDKLTDRKERGVLKGSGDDR